MQIDNFQSDRVHNKQDLSVYYLIVEESLNFARTSSRVLFTFSIMYIVFKMLTVQRYNIYLKPPNIHSFFSMESYDSPFNSLLLGW